MFYSFLNPAFWSEWAPYGDCSSPCGGGEHSRQRTCYLDGDEAPGQCSGPETQSQSCNTQACRHARNVGRSKRCTRSGMF